jgi:hypothetical protein
MAGVRITDCHGFLDLTEPEETPPRAVRSEIREIL